MKKFALAAPVVALALAGCAHDPTIAARVGSQTISIADANLFARVVCASASNNQPVDLSLPTANQAAISALVSSALGSQTAAMSHMALSAQGEAALANYLQQFQASIASLPSADRVRATELVTKILRGEFELSQIAQKEVLSMGQQLTATAVQAATQQLTDAAAAHFGVTVNPRFGSFTSSAQSDTSLSEAVSAAAKAPEADPNTSAGVSYVQGLPVTQRCS